MASSSSRPKPLDLSKRGMYIEPMFDIPSFKDELFCNVAIETIVKSDLMAFARLPEESYPRVVRKFYETLKTDIDLHSGLVTCEVTIDEVQYTFTSKDIAMALKIKGYKPISYDEHEITMREALIYRPPPSNPRNVLRESYLHEDFWVVDKFMKAYACPYIHDNEIPQYLYKYWHGMYTSKVIDVPALMLECMLNARDGGRTKVNPHMLVLPRAITAILKRLKYKFLTTEPKDLPYDVFNYEKVKKSLDAMGEKAGLKEPTKSKKKLAQERRAERLAQEERARAQEEMQGQEDEYVQGQEDEYVQGDWDEYVRYQDPPQDTWGEYARQQQYQPQPPQDQWQNQMFTMMQGYGTMLEGVQNTMQGMNLSMQEGFNRLDTRVGELEATMGRMYGQTPSPQPSTQVYQRQRRRHFISAEEDQDEPME